MAVDAGVSRQTYHTPVCVGGSLLACLLCITTSARYVNGSVGGRVLLSLTSSNALSLVQHVLIIVYA